MGNNCYTITSAQNWQLGAVWFNDQIDLSESFEITLTMNFGNNDGGADGMVFIMQQIGVNAIGDAGGGIGFEGFNASFGVEMDTFKNAEIGDPFSDHMAILANGNVNHFDGLNIAGPIPANQFGANIEDGQDHVFTLDWNADTQVVEVYFDCALRLSLNIDLVDVFFGGDPMVWWGFSGATGGLNNQQSVCISDFAVGLDPYHEICAGESLELGVVGASDGTYEWSPIDYLSSTNTASTIATPEESIIYEVTFTDVCGETQTLGTEVVVANLEFDVPEEISFCEGDPAELVLDLEEDVTVTANGDAVTLPLPLSSTETIDLVLTQNDCSASYSFESIQLEEPSIDWIESYDACDGEEVLIDAFFQDASYSWTGGVISDESQISTTEAGQFDVTLFLDNGCQKSYSTQVNIFSAPEAGLPETVEFCEGQSFVLSPQQGDSFLWSDQSQGSTLEVTESGIYVVEITNNAGCNGADTSTVTVNPLPQVPQLDDAQLCIGESLEIEIPINPDLQYSLNGQTTQGQEILSIAGFYTIDVLNGETQCGNSSFFELTLLELPFLDLPEEIAICEGEVYELALTNTNQFHWFEEELVTEVEFRQGGTYEIQAENDCGQTSAMIEVFEEVCDCDWYVPNAFTPNLDDINEGVGVTAECDFSKFSWRVYNRWGELVFEGASPQEWWYGEGPGDTHYAPDGMYQWILEVELQFADGVEARTATGTVVLLR